MVIKRYYGIYANLRRFVPIELYLTNKTYIILVKGMLQTVYLFTGIVTNEPKQKSQWCYFVADVPSNKTSFVPFICFNEFCLFEKRECLLKYFAIPSLVVHFSFSATFSFEYNVAPPPFAFKHPLKGMIKAGFH